MISLVRKGRLPGRTARIAASVLALALPALLPAAALANPRPLPFSYPWETLTQGEAEIEQFINIAPLYVWDHEHTNVVLEPRYELTTEVEYGITDRLELGLYLAMKNEPESEGAGAPLILDGVKQRLRYRVGREGQLPFELALYFEVAELHDEIELEEKVILQKRFGQLKAVANLWVEQGFERGGVVSFTLHPTAGLVYELNQHATLGAEYWMNAEITLAGDEEQSDQDRWNHRSHHFIGPAISLQWDKLWWSTGVYGRLDDFDRVIRPGDAFGRAWVRTAFGLVL